VTHLRASALALAATFCLLLMIAGASVPIVGGVALIVGVPCTIAYVHELRERWHR
jgi:energy-converting hydrogenase Eha subunit H